MSRSTVKFGALVMFGIAVVAAWITFNPLSLIESAEADGPTPRTTAEVRVADLATSFSSSGTFESASEWSLVLPIGGTVTDVIDAGIPIATGTTLVAIDAQPTVAILGPTPAWRAMTVDDQGVDVLALENALVEMGYDSAGQLTVDGYYTSYTATLVGLWQADQGREVTEQVELGDVIIVPEGTRVASVAVQPGDANTGALMTLSSSSQRAVFNLDADQRVALATGATVEIRFEDRSTSTATISTIEPSGDGAWIATALLAPDAAGSFLDANEIDVSWSQQLGTDLTVVNASALIRLDSGGYVLEVVGTHDRDTTLVPVELGARSGSTVEISGVDSGTMIVVP